MGKSINVKELVRLRESNGRAEAARHVSQALADKHVRADDLSIRDLFVGLVEGGTDLLYQMAYTKSGGRGVRDIMEAANAVDTAAFTNITGQIVFNRIKEAYDDPALIWQDLVTTIPTTFLDGEKIPGIGRIGDKAETVDEGMPYPTVGLSEEYIETARTAKRGMIVPVTREIIVADRTGLLLKTAGEVGTWLGVNKEKRVLDVVFGVTNNYKRNGTATNTYLTSGAYINSAANTLVDWTDVENAELLFDAITDPNTGEPILCMPDTVIVPTALRRTANRILTASEVGHVDNQTNASTYRTMGANPVAKNYAGGAYKVVSSQYVKARTGSAVKWYIGQPKKAFAYMEVWAIETLQAASNSQKEFEQDIMMQFKASERGVPQVLEPRYMVEST